MNNHIIITPEQANAIKGKYGLHSGIDPIATPDGNFIVPENCLNDADLLTAKNNLQSMIKPDNVQNIIDVQAVELPVIGQICTHEGSMVYSPDGHFWAFEKATIKSSLIAPVIIKDQFSVTPDLVKSLTDDADVNIKKLNGNVINCLCDLTDGIRTAATDMDVNAMIADGNTIITIDI